MSIERAPLELIFKSSTWDPEEQGNENRNSFHLFAAHSLLVCVAVEIIYEVLSMPRQQVHSGERKTAPDGLEIISPAGSIEILSSFGASSCLGIEVAARRMFRQPKEFFCCRWSLKGAQKFLDFCRVLFRLLTECFRGPSHSFFIQEKSQNWRSERGN